MLKSLLPNSAEDSTTCGAESDKFRKPEAHPLDQQKGKERVTQLTWNPVVKFELLVLRTIVLKKGLILRNTLAYDDQPKGVVATDQKVLLRSFQCALDETNFYQ